MKFLNFCFFIYGKRKKIIAIILGSHLFIYFCFTIYGIYWQKVRKSHQTQREKTSRAKQKVLTIFNYADLINMEKTGQVKFQDIKSESEKKS